MKIAKAASIRTAGEPAAAQRNTAQHPAALSLLDERAEAVAQGRLAQTIQRHGEHGAQRSLAEKIHHGPRQSAQRAALAGAFGAPIQRVDLEEEDKKEHEGDIQLRAATQLSAGAPDNAQTSSNQTGMPDGLKSGVESLSGLDMSSVRVHRNSARPAQLNALAYAQGNDIHLGPGQDRHLPHEAWHVVQQRQGRVKPTAQTKGVAINDDHHLEKEADVMGAKALQAKAVPGGAGLGWRISSPVQAMPIQMFGSAEVSLEIIAHKADHDLEDVADATIRAYTREYYANAPRISPTLSTVVSTVASGIRRDLTDDSSGFHVPTDKETEKDVDGTTYAFYNDGAGFLDFLAPRNGKPAAPNAGGNWDVNIADPLNPGRVKHTGHPLRSNSRADHFKSANIEREGVNPPTEGSSSPDGWTWHHHYDVGRLQLINRKVHAAFPHKGGFSRWGK